MLASATLRRRAVGRIAGASPACGANALAADWDCCWLDGRPVAGLHDWRRILDAGRIADVSGAWALAWTDAAGVLRLARDPIGERTLYYAARSDGRVAFGSTLAAVLDSGLIERRLHLPALATYLSWAYVPGEQTLAAGVHEVLPGELVEFDTAAVRRSRFWNPPPEPDGSGADETALTARLRTALETAVRRRLPAGEPVAATLSGGIDSSLVVALARKLHDRPVAAYSVFFGERYPNELAWSGLVARHCGVPHRVVEITPAAVLEHLDDTIGELSDPIGDPLTVPNALLFRAAADEAGVVLNGEGGDPCFGGPKNLPMVLASLFDGTLAGDGAFAHEAAYLRAHQKCYDDLGEMLAPEVRAALRDRPLERFVARDFADPRWRTMVQRLQWINLARKGAHHILHKVDEVSAPAGVLSRAPLFDRDVVECAFAIPPQLKLRGAVEKYLLKQAVADLLPREIIDRPKSGMLVPVEGWFRGPLAAAARERLLDGLAPRGLFDRAWLERLVAGKLGGLRPRHGVKIWLLVTLEAWLRRVLG